MKRSLILILACASLLLGGCDFVRILAGRPTSDDLEVKRSFIERAENAARYQARVDSVERVRQQKADSLAAMDARLLDSLSRTKGTVLSSTRMGGLGTAGPVSRYYIIVGVFWNRSSAEYKLAKCQDAGYGDAAILSFQNGLHAVGLCPSNNLDETLKKLHSLRGNGICPPDGWILVNE